MAVVLKWLLRIIIVTVLIVIAGIAYITMVLDPNDYKQDIVVQVEKHTGQSLDIKGDLAWSFYPWLGLQLGEMELANPKGFAGDHLLAVKRVGVSLDVLPLLQKQVVVDKVILQGLDLNLVRNKQGQGNWQSLAKKSEKSEQQQQAETDTQTTASEQNDLISALSIGGISVKQARLVWNDLQNSQHYEVKDLNLETGKITFDQFVDISLEVMLEDHQQQQVAMMLKGQVNIDKSLQKFALNQFDIQLQATAKSLPISPLKTHINTTMAIDLVAQKLNLTQFMLTLQQIQLEASGNIQQFLLNPKFDLNIKANSDNLRQLLSDLNIKIDADPNYIKTLALGLNASGSTNDINIQNLKLNLDESTLTGNVQVKPLPKLGLKFSLLLDKIVLDHYLPQAKATPIPANVEANSNAKIAEHKSAHNKSKQQPLIPVKLLKSLTINGDFKITQLEAKKLKAEDVNIKVNANKGYVKVEQNIGRLYQGNYQSTTIINVKGEQPLLKLEQKLSKVDINALLVDLGQSGLKGATEFSSNLVTRGQTEQDFRQNLSGKIAFDFSDGAIIGYDIGKLIKQVESLSLSSLGRLDFSANPGDETPFAFFRGSADIKRGIVENKDLLLDATVFKVAGEGQIDLVKEEIDYMIKLPVALKELKDGVLPITISGSLSQPKPSVDVKSLLSDQGKQKAAEKVDDLIDKNIQNEEVKQKVKALKDKLFGF